jgi:Fic family protein
MKGTSRRQNPIPRTEASSRAPMLTAPLEDVTASSVAPGAPPALLRRIQGEYVEMPGLILTVAQAQRLWALDDRTCQVVLATLVERRFLRRTTAGAYVRASSTSMAT